MSEATCREPRKRHGGGTANTHRIQDPELQRELESLADPEDRADFVEAMEVLADIESEGTLSWEQVKSEVNTQVR